MTDQEGTAHTPGAAEIRDQLERILGAHGFRASERLRRLLAHLVTLTLEDRQRELTQRHLAEAVFGRGNEFEPERDAIVRVEIRKLRQALQLYYADYGAKDPMVITLPRGAYAPRFERSQHAQAQEDPATASRPGLDPVSLAVLPFVYLGEDRDKDWLAQGVGEELNTILGRIPELHVTPPYTFFDKASVSEQLAQLHNESTVRFAIEGSTRCDGARVRVTARLHDLLLNRQIWSDRYDRNLDTTGLIEIQEDIARNVVAAAADMLTGVIGQSLRSELKPQPDQRLEVYEAMVRFHHYLQMTSDESYEAARRALEEIAARDRSEPLILSMLADLRRAAFALGFTDEPDPIDSCLALLGEAISRAPDCLPCRVSLCFALLHKRDKGGLLEQVETILSDPASPASYRSDVGVPLALCGEWERGCSLLGEQMRTTRFYPHYFQYPLFLHAYRQAEYEKAALLADSFRPAPFFWQPLLHAAVLGQLGLPDEAAPLIERLLALRPNIREHGRRYMSCYLMEDDLVEQLTDGLRRAGLHLQ